MSRNGTLALKIPTKYQTRSGRYAQARSFYLTTGPSCARFERSDATTRLVRALTLCSLPSLQDVRYIFFNRHYRIILRRGLSRLWTYRW